MITDKNKHGAIVYINFEEITELQDNYNDVENVMDSNEMLENLMHHLSRVMEARE